MDDHLVSMLYGVLGVSVVDGDRLRVLGTTAGPAGSSAMDLPGGGTWEVDHLDPSIPVRFEVDLRGADRSPLLIAAFGGDGALYLADQAVDPSERSTDDPVPPRPNRRDYAKAPETRRGDDPDLMTGRVVVLSDLAGDVGSPALVRIAAMAELSLKAYGVSGGELLLSVLPEIRRTAGALATEVADEPPVLDAGLASRLASTLTRFGEAGGPAGSPLVTLAERIRERSIPRAPTFGVVGGGGSSDRVRSGPVVLSFGQRVVDGDRVDTTGDDDGGDEYLAISRTGPGALRVTVARSDRHRWIRVVHDATSLPLAQAPLRPSDLVEVAEVLIPRGVADEDLRVSVIDGDRFEVDEIRPTRLIARAVALGRSAARVCRVRGTVAAAPDWSMCADAWQAVGDVERARSARARMGDIDAGVHVAAYLADEIALALQSAHDGPEPAAGRT